ncbi:MAG TPA: hypothetical protein VED63_06450 [Acidimicrobiales bacterium]|nr:hypothetical protein [Acidimicrobiales bacterium]
MPEPLTPGAMVVSLDFELHWGMRDHTPPTGPVAAELVRSRAIVAELADVFVERSIHVTWATVGFLFASRRDDLDSALPPIRPAYVRAELDPYRETIGVDEDDDPVHLAGSLVRRLAASPGQEVASHTFSHFYSLEGGQDEAAWRSDLNAARAIAAADGIEVTSLVLPRNQWNPRYATATLECGFTCIRGPQPSLGNRPGGPQATLALRRAARLADTYVGIRPPPTTSWADVVDVSGLCNVPASAFLRPYSPTRRALEPLRRARLVAGLRDAARRGRIFHLWWHPHNFARHPGPNMDLLARLLDEFARLSESDGLRSLSMRDVTDVVMAPEHGHDG